MLRNILIARKLGAFAWAIIDIVLLIFLGLLLAVVLRTLAKPIARYTPLTAQ